MTDNRNGPWMTRRDDQTPTPSSDIDSFLAEIRGRNIIHLECTRPANLRARCHSQPAADLGYRLPATGRNVS